jgi:hypothetical protein
MNITITQQMLDDNEWLCDAEFEVGKTYHISKLNEFANYFYSGFSTNPPPSKQRPQKPVPVA